MSDLSFRDLGLAEPILRALDEIGYETPSPIQAQSIPALLEGSDLLGVAQTGTGKTAAFALPILTNLEFDKSHTQLLILTPTRELAIQVAEACQSYAKHINKFHVLPIYGGQSYDNQLRQLKKGSQVVVGTPGRVMDHIRRGSLKLSQLKAVVLDEADEMLRMGFIDDVEWILQHAPKERQTALFSATMPSQIKRVASKYLVDATEVKIVSKTTTATTITQKYWKVSGLNKLDALTRILELQQFDAMLIFVRTKSATEELAAKLSARGYSAEALNGDLSQQQRERAVDRLKQSKIDILIGTDVVARGLDVGRISHVLNYDIPYDTESYVHRIGRTGRAGRTGEAILFVSPREQRMLQSIERATKQRIEPMSLPSIDEVNEKRVERFLQKITSTLVKKDTSLYLDLISEYQQQTDTDPLQIAAAMALIAQGKQNLFLTEQPHRPERERRERTPHSNDGRRKRSERSRNTGPMNTYRIDVGRKHKVQPKNIVGAIANEADISSSDIGSIEIYDGFSTVDLPKDVSTSKLKRLERTFVCGQSINIKLDKGSKQKSSDKGPRKRPAKKS